MWKLVFSKVNRNESAIKNSNVNYKNIMPALHPVEICSTVMPALQIPASKYKTGKMPALSSVTVRMS